MQRTFPRRGLQGREIDFRGNLVERDGQALARADKGWLRNLISRCVPVERWHEAFERQPDDVKVVITFAGR